MTNKLPERLNAILPKITSSEFLSGSGLGNEVAFFIFDYPPEDELAVREHVKFLLQQIPKVKPGLRITHVDLLRLAVGHLKERKLLDKALDMQRTQGDEAMLKALAAPLHAEKLAQVFVREAKPAESDLVLVTGAGNAWPLVRIHSLLSNLHPLMGQTPLVLFYPGRYDGQYLRLFGKLKQDNYYRAFRLVP